MKKQQGGQQGIGKQGPKRPDIEDPDQLGKNAGQLGDIQPDLEQQDQQQDFDNLQRGKSRQQGGLDVTMGQKNPQQGGRQQNQQQGGQQRQQGSQGQSQQDQSDQRIGQQGSQKSGMGNPDKGR